MTKKSETCVELTAPYQLVFSGMACVQPLTSVTTTFSFHNSHQKGASHLNTNLVVYNVNGSLYTLTQFHNGYQGFSNLCEWFHALRYFSLDNVFWARVLFNHFLKFQEGVFSTTFFNFIFLPTSLHLPWRSGLTLLSYWKTTSTGFDSYDPRHYPCELVRLSALAHHRWVSMHPHQSHYCDVQLIQFLLKLERSTPKFL